MGAGLDSDGVASMEGRNGGGAIRGGDKAGVGPPLFVDEIVPDTAGGAEVASGILKPGRVAKAGVFNETPENKAGRGGWL